MNRAFSSSVILACGFVLSAAALPAAPAARATATDANKGVVKFERTKSRIDALLSQRMKPEPLPETLPNPFQLVEAAPAVTPLKPTPERLLASSDSEMLLYYGASLKISGTVRTDDQTHLIINQNAYKEGDTLKLKTKDGEAKLHIIAIAPGELTLGLNDAVQVIKFKK